jgi:GNAT superfamily N-acetyltransferase
MALIVRDHLPEDLPRLQEIRAAAFAPVFAGFRAALGAEIAAVALKDAEAGQAALFAGLAEGADHMLLVAAEPAPLGFAGLRLDRAAGLGEIVLMAVVDPGAQGRGVGRRLVAAALAQFRAEGFRAAVVGAGGDAAHAPARQIYAEAGFAAALPSVHLYRAL